MDRHHGGHVRPRRRADLAAGARVDHRRRVPEPADVFRLGASYRATPALELRLWGSLERWSLFKQECLLSKATANFNCALTDRGVPTATAAGVINVIPRAWQDAVAVRAGASYWLKPSIELLFGAGYDGNAVPDKTLELSLPDQQKINLTAGAIFRDFGVNQLSLHVEYSAFIGFKRTVAPRTTEPYDPPSRVPDSAGDYSEFVGVLTVGLGYAF